MAAPEGIDYVSLYLDSPHLNESPASLLALFVLGLMRLIPIVGVVPFLGAKNLIRPAKISFAILILLVMFPKVVTMTTQPLQYDGMFVMLMLKEFVVGFTIGLLTAMPFHVAQTAGIIIDQQRGASSLMVNDPIFLNQDAPIGVLFNYLGIILFMWMNGPFMFFDALLKSYEVIPPDQFFSRTLFSPEGPFFLMAVDLLNKEVTIAVQLATPAILAILMTDLFLGIVNRLAPQVMISFLGLPLKSMLGLGMIWVGWLAILRQLVKNYIHWMEVMKDFVINLLGT